MMLGLTIGEGTVMVSRKFEIIFATIRDVNLQSFTYFYKYYPDQVDFVSHHLNPTSPKFLEINKLETDGRSQILHLNFFYTYTLNTCFFFELLICHLSFLL